MTKSLLRLMKELCQNNDQELITFDERVVSKQWPKAYYVWWKSGVKTMAKIIFCLMKELCQNNDKKLITFDERFLSKQWPKVY